MEARMIPCHAVIRSGVGNWWETAGRESRGWRKLCCTSPPHHLAAIQFFWLPTTLSPIASAIHCILDC